MFSLFIALLSFSEALATKCMFLNNEPRMVRPTLIDMNHVEFKYYSFIISLNKYTGSCNVLSPIICVPKEIKDINVKAFNMVTNQDEAKAMAEHVSCDCKCKFNSTIFNSNEKWNNKPCHCECKNYRKCKKDYSWNPSKCICGNSTYSKGIADTSVTECDEVISAIDMVSRKKTNTVATKKTNVMSTASINCHSKKVIDLKPLRIRFDKIHAIVRIYDRTRYLTLFGSENMMLFTTELDISHLMFFLTFSQKSLVFLF